MAVEPILSASEIEGILAVARRKDNGGLNAHAQPIDLLADDRSVRSLIPTLRIGFARSAEALRRVLTSVLRTKVEVHDEPPETVTGRGLVSVASTAACLVVLRITTPQGSRSFGVLALDSVFTFSVIQRLFGGGHDIEQAPAGRSPTALERRMLLRALIPMLETLNEHLEPAGYFHIEGEQDESRLDLVPGYSPDTTALHVPFTMNIGDKLASFSLTLPTDTLEPLRARLHEQTRDGQSSATLGDVMGNVMIDISADLGETTILLRDLLVLEPGQTLLLDRHRGDALPVRIAGIPKFEGHPVEQDGIISIELTGPLQ